MANNNYYGYSPKKEKPLKTRGQAYSGAEKSTRKGQVIHMNLEKVWIMN